MSDDIKDWLWFMVGAGVFAILLIGGPIAVFAWADQLNFMPIEHCKFISQDQGKAIYECWKATGH